MQVRLKEIISKVPNFVFDIPFFMPRIRITKDWFKAIVGCKSQKPICDNWMAIFVFLANTCRCKLIEPNLIGDKAHMLKHGDQAFLQGFHCFWKSNLAKARIASRIGNYKFACFFLCFVFVYVYFTKVDLSFSAWMLQINEAWRLVNLCFFFPHNITHSTFFY